MLRYLGSMKWMIIYRDVYRITDGNVKLDVKAEKIINLIDKVAIMVKNKGKYSMYMQRIKESNGQYYSYGIYKIIDEIIDYKYSNNLLLFRKDDGWYFLFFDYLINYSNDNKNNKMYFPRMCEEFVQILNVKVFKTKNVLNEEKESYIITTNYGTFILSKSNDKKFGKFVQFFGYENIIGYENLVKMYMEFSGKVIKIGRLTDCVTSDSCAKFEDMGDGFFILNRKYQYRKEQCKLIFFGEREPLQTCVEWGNHKIIRLDKVNMWSIDNRIFEIKIDSMGLVIINQIG